MRLKRFKKLICFAAAVCLSASALTACGSKTSQDTDQNNTASTQNNTTQETQQFNPDATPYAAKEIPNEFKAAGKNIKAGENGAVVVALKEMEDEERHEFLDEDLGFVDTMSGALLRIGMTAEEIENIIGTPRSIDIDARIYDGLVVQFDEDGKAIKLVVTEGYVLDTDNPKRYVSPRGISLGSSLDDFKSVYGDEYKAGGNTENAEGSAAMNGSTRAIRYYAKNGNSFSYIGESTSKDTRPENDADLISQMFLFSAGENTVSAMTVQTGESKP